MRQIIIKKRTDKQLICLLIVRAFICLLIATYLSTAQNIDSISYVEKILSLQTNKDSLIAELSTAKALADVGLYNEATILIEELILKKNSFEKTSHTKKVKTTIDFFYNQNKLQDYNDKELTQSQKDSVNLLKKITAATGITQVWNLNGKFGLQSISPQFWFSNIASTAKFSIKAAYFDNILQIKNCVGIEKLIGEFTETSTSNQSISDSVNDTTGVSYQWIGFNNDSSDIFTNNFSVKLSNKRNNNRFIFSAPFKWKIIKCRINTPNIASRSIYSTNPFFEYRLRNTDLTISGNWNFEYIDYFGIGQTMIGDTMDIYSINYLDRIYNTPIFNITLYLNRLNIELSEAIIHEHFPQRKSFYSDIAERIRQNEFVNTFETLENGLWFETTNRVSFRVSQFIDFKHKAQFLKAYNRNVHIEYEKRESIFPVPLNAKATEINQEGLFFRLEPLVEIKPSQKIKARIKYAYEYRTATISDPIGLFYSSITDSVFYARRYVWENYVAHQPSLSCSFTNDHFKLRISETFRFEDVVSDSAYSLCSSTSWRTQMDFFLTINSHISISFIGDLELISNRKDEMLNPDYASAIPESSNNISLNVNLVFQF